MLRWTSECKKVYWSVIPLKGKGRIGWRKPSDSDIEATASLPAQGELLSKDCLLEESCVGGSGRPFTILLSQWLGLPQQQWPWKATMDLKELTAGSCELITLLATSSEVFLEGVLNGAPLCLPPEFFFFQSWNLGTGRKLRILKNILWNLFTQ